MNVLYFTLTSDAQPGAALVLFGHTHKRLTSRVDGDLTFPNVPDFLCSPNARQGDLMEGT